MTTGEKIKEARTAAGLSQEQFAEKLCISRQAVTKWETGRGMPDIMNLKAISALLDVSIDWLLNEDTGSARILKEKIEKEKYAHVKWYQAKEDFIILDKYPNARSIVQLSRKRRMNRAEKVADTALWLLTDFPPTAELFDLLRDPSLYYLVETEQTDILVNVTKDFITSQILPSHVKDKSFDVGENRFTKIKRKLK